LTTTAWLAKTRVGIGVRAGGAIKKGSRIDAWEPGDMIWVPLNRSPTSIIEMAQRSDRWEGFLRAEKSNAPVARPWYINHSERPNVNIAVSPKKWTIRARRDIKAGEELTVDYGTLDFNPKLNRGKRV
jgi:hypothetical protein